MRVFLLASIVFLHAAAGYAQTVGGLRDLAAGRFLVAGRNLPDPNFAQSVILLVRYDAKGTLGLVINRQSEIPVSRVLQDMKGAEKRTDGAFIGGPVARGGVMALVRSRTAPAEAGRVFEDIYVVSDRELLEKAIAAGQQADTLRVYLGYSGWAAGQLEREVAMETWHIFGGDAKMVFDPDPPSVWQRLIRRTELQVAFGFRPNGGGR